MNTCRLIYRSHASDDATSNENLGSLEKTAVSCNSNSGITGLLVLVGSVFLQVLEGPSRDVNRLYRNIVGDTRHSEVELLSYEMEVEPLFAQWSMRLVDLYDLPGEIRSLMAQRYGGRAGELQIPEQIQRLYAFLFDAEYLCTNKPWLSLPAAKNSA